MSWRDRLQPASFRNVSFFVDSVDTENARRTVVQRFPGRRDVRVQDLGREATIIGIDAYVIGPDYDLALSELEYALLEGGKGKLVHPYRGEFTCVVTGPVRTSESKEEGGFARVRFEVTEVEAVDLRIRGVRSDTAAAVENAADAASDAASESFVDNFDVSDLPSGFRSTSVTALGDAAASLRNAHDGVTASLSVVDTVSAEIDELSANASALITTPEKLASSVVSLASSVLGAATSVRAAARRQGRAIADAVTSIAGFAEDFLPIPELSPSRTQEAQNREALVQLVRAASSVEAARYLARVQFVSRDDAVRARRRVSFLLDSVAATAGDVSYTSIVKTRTALIRHLEQVARSLPELAEFTPGQEMPALVIAHHLYGDARRAEEIIDRNNIRNPALVSPSETLEVLSA